MNYISLVLHTKNLGTVFSTISNAASACFRQGKHPQGKRLAAAPGLLARFKDGGMGFEARHTPRRRPYAAFWRPTTAKQFGQFEDGLSRLLLIVGRVGRCE